MKRFFTALFVSCLLAAPGRSALRNPTIDDFLRLEEFGLVRPSPDGRRLAVEIYRPRAALAQRLEDGGGYTRSDIWLIEPETGKSLRITNGGADGSAFWCPIWSPSGDKLAVLTNSGFRNVRAAVIDLSSGRFHLLSDRAIDTEANFGSPSPYAPAGRLWGAWISNTEFISALLPVGMTEAGDWAANPAASFGPRWERTFRGEKSVTIWDTRSPAVAGAGATLTLFDANTSGEPITLMTGSIRAVTISPNHELAAVIVATRPKPGTLEPLGPSLEYNAYDTDMRVETALIVCDLGARKKLGTVAGVGAIGFASARRHPRWSGDSESLFVPSFDPAAGNFVYRVSARSLRAASTPARSPLDAELLAALLQRQPTQSPAPFAERVELAANTIGRDMGMKIEGSLLEFSDRSIAVLDGRGATLLDGNGRPVHHQPVAEALLLTPVISGQPRGVFLLQSGDQALALRRSGNGLSMHQVAPPSGSAMALLAVGDGNEIIWEETLGGIHCLWSTRHPDKSTPLITLNGFLKEVKTYATRTIAYALPNGQRVGAALLLPEGYDNRKTYPVVIDGYPGVVVDPGSAGSFSIPAADRSVKSRNRPLFDIGSFYHSHRFLLAARGYIVAVPSIPVPYGPIEPLELVAGDVEAFAEGLVAQGIAARGQIGFYGHSYGGFTALSVLTRTRLISAVVASAPFADLIDSTDHEQVRYTFDPAAPNRHRFHLFEYESANAYILRMAGASDLNLEKYIRNSPRFQLRATAPPLLMINGEFDGRGFQQVDAIYNVLSRYGVPVQSARYWGEGHSLGSPGNVKDAWERTIGWYETYLTNGKKDSPAPTP